MYLKCPHRDQVEVTFSNIEEIHAVRHMIFSYVPVSKIDYFVRSRLLEYLDQAVFVGDLNDHLYDVEACVLARSFMQTLAERYKEPEAIDESTAQSSSDSAAT